MREHLREGFLAPVALLAVLLLASLAGCAAGIPAVANPQRAFYAVVGIFVAGVVLYNLASVAHALWRWSGEASFLGRAVLLFASLAGCAAGIPAVANPQRAFYAVVGTFVAGVVLYNLASVAHALWRWRAHHPDRLCCTVLEYGRGVAPTSAAAPRKNSTRDGQLCKSAAQRPISSDSISVEGPTHA